MPVGAGPERRAAGVGGAVGRGHRGDDRRRAAQPASSHAQPPPPRPGMRPLHLATMAAPEPRSRDCPLLDGPGYATSWLATRGIVGRAGSAVQHQADLLELLQVAVAALGHRPRSPPNRFRLPSGSSLGPYSTVSSDPSGSLGHAERAARQLRVAGRRVPPRAAGRRLVAARQRLAEHHRVGPAAQRLGDVAAGAAGRRRR